MGEQTESDPNSHFLVHDYLGVDLDAVWLVVKLELPPLQVALARMETALHARK